MKSYTIPRPDNFDVTKIFDCGQCFRFLPCENELYAFEGIAHGKYIKIIQKEETVTFEGTDEFEFNNLWSSYFALDVDYKKIQNDILSLSPDDTVLNDAINFGTGIRLLKQDKWETLCSFIISQNNNIPRIRSLIEGISKKYGDKITFNGKEYFAFPSPEKISTLSESDLRELKVGFRASYILDAAKKVASSEIDLNEISKLTTDELLKSLMTIKGVGLKVASCVCLFAYERLDCFPIDVWIRKVLNTYYPSGFDYKIFGSNAGLVQQYLFYYERYRKG